MLKLLSGLIETKNLVESKDLIASKYSITSINLVSSKNNVKAMRLSSSVTITLHLSEQKSLDQKSDNWKFAN